MIRPLEVFAERRYPGHMIALHLFEHLPNGNTSLVTGFQCKELEPVEAPLVSDDLLISEGTAQQLMDQLWNCGIRPAEGSGSAGSLRATENHLHDMQKMTDRLMNMFEKSFYPDIEYEAQK
jgi:hypothetical protein